MKDNNAGLSEKQKKFCREYLKDFNGTQAAIRAKYSKKTANEQASRLLANVNISSYIKELTEKIAQEDIMDVNEIQQRLTKIARGVVEEDVVVVENTGDFCSEAKVIKKKACIKDQTKALELLGKTRGMFIDTHQNLEPPVVVDDIPGE